MANYKVNIRSKEAWQRQVEDKDLTTSPAGTKGKRYIIAGIGGGWSGGTINDIAVYDGASYIFYTPAEGWMVYVKDEDKIYRYTGSAWVAYKTANIGIDIDGGGSVISSGYKGFIRVTKACEIKKVTLLGDKASGSVVVDIWKCSYANYDGGVTHPVNADSITSAAPPTITSASKSEDSTLNGWTKSIAAGEILGFNVDSCSTFEKVILELEVTKV